MLDRLPHEVRDLLRFLAVVVPAYLGFTTVAFAAYSIPSESMVPTLEVDDRVLVSKFAYGYSRVSLPLGAGDLLPPGGRRLFETLPRHGDVVVFRHPKQRKTVIKRLVGLPGDVISVEDGRLVVNGVRALRQDPKVITRIVHGENDGAVEKAVRYREDLSQSGAHIIQEFADDRQLDAFGPVTVPARHVFVMGDNRDNSLDSRTEEMGFVPIDNLIGRAETIYFTMPRFEPGWAEAPRARLFRSLAAEPAPPAR